MSDVIIRECGRCNQKFEARSWNATFCRKCIVEMRVWKQKLVERAKEALWIPEELKPFLSVPDTQMWLGLAFGEDPILPGEVGSETIQEARKNLLEDLKKAKDEAEKLFQVIADEIEMGYQELDFRPHYRFPSDLVTLGDELREKLLEMLKKEGYIRVSKWVWRKWNIEPEAKRYWEEVFEGKRPEWFYAVYAGWQLLLRTNPTKKDWLGYDAVDCWIALDFYNRWAKKKVIEDSGWQWLQRKLPRYRDQIRELGLDFERVAKALTLKPEGEIGVGGR